MKGPRDVLLFKRSDFGEGAAQITVGNNWCTIVADAANREEINLRIAQIKKELSETDSVYDTEKLSERIAKLAGGVAVIKVRAHTALAAAPGAVFSVLPNVAFRDLCESGQAAPSQGFGHICLARMDRASRPSEDTHRKALGGFVHS